MLAVFPIAYRHWYSCAWLSILVQYAAALNLPPRFIDPSPRRNTFRNVMDDESNQNTPLQSPDTLKRLSPSLTTEPELVDAHMTRRLKSSVFMAVTLDGMIATSSGDVSFLDNYSSEAPSQSSISRDHVDERGEDNDMGFTAFLKSVDIIIMGRKTFDKVVSFGLDQWAYGSVPIVVWSVQRLDVTIPISLADTVSCSILDPKSLVAELQQQGYTHAYVDGGYTVQRFLAHGLIDSLILTTVPLILGEGISLFRGFHSSYGPNDSSSSPMQPYHRPINLQHVTTQVFPNGLVQNRYSVIHPS